MTLVELWLGITIILIGVVLFAFCVNEFIRAPIVKINDALLAIALTAAAGLFIAGGVWVLRWIS